MMNDTGNPDKGYNRNPPMQYNGIRQVQSTNKLQQELTSPGSDANMVVGNWNHSFT
jgi:hypothetical protein